jgi:two-component system, sensor histidine kinase
MVEPTIPVNEAQRLAALERYAILDTPAEASFDRVVRIVARIFAVPIAMVTFIDKDRQWFKACFGTDLRENTRALSFCSHTILSDGVMVVPDALLDDRFRDNPVVQGLGLRFYAGAPLRTIDGLNIGTLCIYDVQPRADLSSDQRETMLDLAASVVDDLEARLTAQWAARAELQLARANQELAQRLEQVKELNAAQQRFAADASHELRAPLTLIQGNIDLILAHPNLEPSERDIALNEAKNEAERLGRLVTDMLHLVRNGADQTQDHVRLDFEKIVRLCLEESRPLAHAHTMKVNLESKGHVIGQADRIKQLVLILLGNALKYTPGSGLVTITAIDLEHEVELRVEDTGIGVGESELERVFERFYRTGLARNQFSDGTGLGLPIARSIVEAHGGSIWMESVIDQGSRVIVRLPRTLEVS